jgi:predicted CoA-binding protein
MKTGRIITSEEEIKDILQNSKNIAVLGLSPKPERDSNKVALYLKAHGYKVIPVHPAQKEVIGEKAYTCVDKIDIPVDIVDVFRNPSQIMGHAKEAVAIKPKVFWMQLNIENQEAASFLTSSGIDVIMNRCIKIDHEKLIK